MRAWEGDQRAPDISLHRKPNSSGELGKGGGDEFRRNTSLIHDLIKTSTYIASTVRGRHSRRHISLT
jgi:hypothetical protein